MKRRLSSNHDDDDSRFPCDASPSTFSTRRQKRARYDSLERTLAHMTLGSAFATVPEDVAMWPKTSSPPNVILPSSVEEPGTPVSESVDMEIEPTTSVTADTFAATPSPHAIQSVESGRLDIEEVQISPAVLECLKRQSKYPPRLIPSLPCQTSQALVLYRAPRPPPLKSACEQSTVTSNLGAREDDVMEVE